MYLVENRQSHGPHGEFLTGQRGQSPAAAAPAAGLVPVGNRGCSAKVAAGYPLVPKTRLVPGDLVDG